MKVAVSASAAVASLVGLASPAGVAFARLDGAAVDAALESFASYPLSADSVNLLLLAESSPSASATDDESDLFELFNSQPEAYSPRNGGLRTPLAEIV